MNNVFKRNIDVFPYTGEREVEGFLKVSERDFLDPWFNGNEKYDQVSNVTRGKIYKVVRVIGYGDCESAVILDDSGNEHALGQWFFEELTEEEYQKVLNDSDQMIRKRV